MSEAGNEMQPQPTITLGELTWDNIDRSGPSGDAEFTYVDIGSVDRERKVIVAPEIVPVEKAPSRAKQRLKAGDVLVSMTRPNLNAVAIVPQTHDGAIGSTGFHVLRARDAEPRFLYYAVRTTQFVQEMSRKVQGALYPAVRPPDISSFCVPAFTLQHQRRIVAKIEELFSELDKGIENLKQARAQLTVYRQSLLKHAFEGHLTADWRAAHAGELENADKLVRRMSIERRSRWEELEVRKFKANGNEPPKDWKTRYREPVPAESIALPPQPNGWAFVSMDSLTCRITSGSRDWQQYYDKGTGTFIMAQNVRPGRFDRSFRQQVSPPADDSSCERSRVEKDDLLVTIVGANTGNLCRVPDAVDEHYVCQSVALMRPVFPQMARFLELYFNATAGGLSHYRRYIYGAGRPHLSFDQLQMTPVALPPLAEQEAIITAVEDQLSVINHLETDIDMNLQKAEALRQSILKKAFAGKLVPQDPNDEPASELSARIRAERAALAPTPKSKKPRKAALA